MVNKEDNENVISNQNLNNGNTVSENKDSNVQKPLKVALGDNSMEINIEQSDSPVLQLNFDKMDINSVSPPQSPSSSLNPILPENENDSEFEDTDSNDDKSDTDIENDDNEEDYGKSNFIIYKKIASNNNDPIDSLKNTKPSKSILKVTNVQPQKNTFLKKEWFKEKFGTSGNTISSAFKSFSNNANMAIERQINNLTNGQSTWKSKSSDSIYLNNYYNDSIGNTMAIDETNRLNPEDEKNDICNSMDSFLGDIPKRVRFSFEDITTALANDENRLSYYQIQLQQIQQQQQQLQRNQPLPITQRRDSLNHSHPVQINNSNDNSPSTSPKSSSTQLDNTNKNNSEKNNINENGNNNVNNNNNNDNNDNDNENNNNDNNDNKKNDNNNNKNDNDNDNQIDSNSNNVLSSSNDNITSSEESISSVIEKETSSQNNINNIDKDNNEEKEPVIEVEGIKEGDEVNLDDLYNTDEEDNGDANSDDNKPKVDPRSKYPLTPAQILKAYEIEWKRRNEKPIIPIINMLNNKINENEKTVPIIDIHDYSITKTSVISLADLLATRFGLETLNLENTGIVNEELKIILNSLLPIKTLKHLNIANNPKSSEGVKYISSFLRKQKRLRSLNISKFFINWELISYLSIALESNTSLRLLIMNGCQVNYHDFLKMFAKGIHKSKLKYLCFKNNKFNSDCGEMLAHLVNPYIPLFKKQDMTSLNGLTYINLSNCRLKPCFYSFSKGLINNPTLEYLIIRNNNLEGSDLAIISEILIQNDILQVLDVSKNKKLCAEAEQVIQLKNALIANKTLTELNMAQTGITSEGAISIAEIFPLNKSIRILDLRSNPIEIAGVVALSVSLKMNNTITSLQLSQFIIQTDKNEIEPEFQRILYDILISCSRNMSINPYVEKNSLSQFKDLDISHCNSPLETNDHFYQKILNTPKKLMQKNSSSSLSNRNSSINGSRNSLNNAVYQNNSSNINLNSNSSLNYNIPQQFDNIADNHSISSMDNNIDASVVDEQLKYDTELAIKLSKEEEDNRKLKESIESLTNDILLLEQMINSDSSEKEIQDIVLNECEKYCKQLVQRIVEESIKDEVISNEILALNDRYTVITEKIKERESLKENKDKDNSQQETINNENKEDTSSNNSDNNENSINNDKESNSNKDSQPVDTSKMIMEIDSILKEDDSD
ncbi:RNI-like protein [Anaeromyces robustus]|uniref:RNI-like protein n=1 Tax=Anaeromyces robustus TaxID=1754192 RepID=A0A1Y1WXW4_9FUNG|nr:RNI-like protein [Anaeromyces robustus]|eukprot:ORX78400.1 RNI-like protein [Anaeromyces robustus]